MWLPTDVMILPSCRRIGYGAVVGSGSVVVKDVDSMTVVSGNPAIEFKKRKCVHSDLVVESLLGGDYMTYKLTRKSEVINKFNVSTSKYYIKWISQCISKNCTSS